MSGMLNVHPACSRTEQIRKHIVANGNQISPVSSNTMILDENQWCKCDPKFFFHVTSNADV